MTRTIQEGSITRRSALRRGLGWALASAVPYKLFGETIVQRASRTATIPAQAELYVFPGAGQGKTAIAVIWPKDTGQDCLIRIHADIRTWEFRASAHGVCRSQHRRDFSVFIGDVVPRVKAHGRAMKAVVMEVDAGENGLHGSSAIWAERLVGGRRQRIGTPFLSEILRDHEDLAHRYHASSPGQDTTVLLQPLSAAIAGRLQRVGSAANPDSHAHRLAYALLPDVLHYDPRLPAGFTFAAQNGRHPSESSDEIVHAILNGGKPSDSIPANPHPSVPVFPYFEQRTAAV
jgi:hypothetical protein